MEMDFSSEMIEKLLLKRALNDKSWLNILTNIYDKRWFKVKNLGTIMKLVITFYNKYATIPSIKVIQALIQKHVEKSPDTDIKLAEVNELLSEEYVLYLVLKDYEKTNCENWHIYAPLLENELFKGMLKMSKEKMQKVASKDDGEYDLYGLKFAKI